MKVLITGGAGFIGSHLAAALLDGRAEVRILDNLRGRNRWSLKGLNLDMVEASVLDTNALRAAVSEWMSFSISPL
jgi:UDP-glucose 4-epimerase